MVSLKSLITILARSQNPLAVQCLDKIKSDEIRFQPGFSKSKNEIESLYSFRLKMAETINRDQFDEIELDSWRKAMDELKSKSLKEVHLCSVVTMDKYYLIFLNERFEELAAIFALNHKRSFEEMDKNTVEILERGFTSSTLKFKNGNQF